MTESSNSGQKPADARSTAELHRNAHVLVLQEMRTRFTDVGSPSRTDALDAAISALSAQPSPGGLDALSMIGANLRSIVRLCRPEDYSTSRLDAANIHMEARHALQLLEEALAARQPVAAAVKDSLTAGGGKPVGDGWSGWATQYPGKMPKLYGAREIAEVNHHPDEGQRLIFLAEQPAQAVDLAPAAIPDTPEVRDILGRPNFWCSPWANVLRMRGDEIPHKAEEEQAAVIRFMLNHYLTNGTAWAETAGAELDAIRKADSQAVGNG